MYILDMHCDSLLRVNSDRGLVNSYNLSKEYPQIQLFAAYVPRADDTAEARRRKLMHYTDIYISECKRLGIVPIESCRDLNFALELELRGGIFAIEGGGGLFADSEELQTLYKMGLRVLGLAWDGNELSSSVWDEQDRGLTDEGIAMVKKCSELGIILDVSHLSDRAVDMLLDTTAYPVIATHSNFRDVCPSPRNLTLEQARKITARGGVIGLNLYPNFLNESGRATVNDIYAQVDYALERLGEDCLGFGFDIDGTSNSYPQGLDESTSIHDRVVDMLLARYDERVVEKIAGMNAISFFKNNL